MRLTPATAATRVLASSSPGLQRAEIQDVAWQCEMAAEPTRKRRGGVGYQHHGARCSHPLTGRVLRRGIRSASHIVTEDGERALSVSPLPGTRIATTPASALNAPTRSDVSLLPAPARRCRVTWIHAVTCVAALCRVKSFWHGRATERSPRRLR
jgi:hypothetical protein